MHAVVSIAKAIQENSNMRSVDLDGNLIGEDGALLLLQTISASAHLRSLVVTHQISKETFQSITEALHKNNKDSKVEVDNLMAYLDFLKLIMLCAERKGSKEGKRKEEKELNFMPRIKKIKC